MIVPCIMALCYYCDEPGYRLEVICATKVTQENMQDLKELVLLLHPCPPTQAPAQVSLYPAMSPSPESTQ